jgi:hypothetical protein
MKPKLVLFVGNGFTIGLSHHIGLSDVHDTTRLIPPPEWILEASQSLSATALPLWNNRRYPSLWAEWEKFSSSESMGWSPTSFQGFCANLSKNTSYELGPDPEGGPMMIANSRDAGFQLRRYLWRLFYLYNFRLLYTVCPMFDGKAPPPDTLMHGLRESTLQWPIMNLLCTIAAQWELSIVSFNYDSYVEVLLTAHGYTPYPMADRCYDFIDKMPVDSFRVLHPHGSMSDFRPGVSGLGPASFDDTFEDGIIFLITHDVSDYFPSRFIYPYQYPCPDYPDLVPPGHSSDHLMAKWSDYPKTIGRLVSEADVIGCLGFSSVPPDDTEFAIYVRKVKQSAKAFSIGLRDSSRELRSQQILSKAVGSSSQEFFDISEVEECERWLNFCFNESLFAEVEC